MDYSVTFGDLFYWMEKNIEEKYHNLYYIGDYKVDIIKYPDYSNSNSSVHEFIIYEKGSNNKYYLNSVITIHDEIINNKSGRILCPGYLISQSKFTLNFFKKDIVPSISIDSIGSMDLNYLMARVAYNNIKFISKTPF